MCVEVIACYVSVVFLRHSVYLSSPGGSTVMFHYYLLGVILHAELAIH